MTNELLQTLHAMVEKKNKKNSFRTRARIKGRITKKNVTKNNNITLTIKRGEREINFLVLKHHKNKFALAQKLNINNPVFAEGIRKFRFIICTKLNLKQIRRNKTNNIRREQ